HDGVTGIDTEGAANALVLEAVTNIDPGRTHLHAHAAVDTVSQIGLTRIDSALAATAWLPPVWVIGDDHGIAIEHHRLESGIGAHVETDLLAQPACVQVGGQREESDPEISPATGVKCKEVGDQFADGVE